MEEFTLKFDEFLNKLNPSKYDIYIMGDMNIDLLKYHSHQQTERYLDMIYSLDLSPVITKPTRITNHTVTLIDLIYINNVNRLISGIVTVDISDHLPVFCLVDTPLKKQNRQNTYFRACLHEGGGPQVGEVTWGGLPHLSCKRDHIKMRDYMDRRVTPPKQVTSPIWGTPPPCKQPVPNILNVSQVTPVYKSGDATDPANYRPISTLSSFRKVFEKLIYNQLYNFLEKYSILYKYQFGFRKGYSTEQAI